MLYSNCIFCDIINQINLLSNPVENTVIYEDDFFIIVPALGPLYPGHTLIISKEHVTSISNMSKDSITKCYELMARIKAFLNQFPCILFSEHGACDEYEAAGACIIHAHIQCIPLSDEFDFSNIELFVTEDKVNSYFDILNWNKPYLYINHNGIEKIYLSEAVPSQLIRKMIYASKGRTDWDWRNNRKDDMIKETLELWKGF